MQIRMQMQVQVNNTNVGQGGNVSATMGHTTATTTTSVTGNNPITATGMVQTPGPPPLIPMKESTQRHQEYIMREESIELSIWSV